jgi:hypothetical protein
VSGLKEFDVLCKIRDISEAGIGLCISKKRYFSRNIKRGELITVAFEDSYISGLGEKCSVSFDVDAKVAFIQEEDEFFIVGCEINDPEYFHYVVFKKKSEENKS